MIEFIAIIFASLIIIYAICEFISRFVRKEPFWTSLKKLLVNVWDAISGIG